MNSDNNSKLVLPSNSSYLFANMKNVTEIDGLNKLDVSKVDSFEGMFAEDEFLLNADLSSFEPNQQKALNLSKMFYKDFRLHEVDISKFTNSDDNIENIFYRNNRLYQIKISGLDFSEDSGLDADSWINPNDEKENQSGFPQGGASVSTWNLKVSERNMSETFFSFGLYSNKDVMLKSNDLEDSEPSEDYSSMLASDFLGEKLFMGVLTVKKSIFSYVGQTITIQAPTVSGYTANPNTVKVKLETFNGDPNKIGAYELDVSESEKSFAIIKDGNRMEHNYTIYYTKNPAKVTPPTTHHTTTPTVTSKYTHKLQTLTTYPDQNSANIYDEDGNLSKTVALSPDSNWQTDEYMTIKGEKYYRVATNEFVKASDIYLYTPKYSVVRTHDGADYISLDNSHGDTVTNRALAVKTDWKIDKVIKINNEDYYRVATNEFVKADNVDVIR
ncbi:MAG TPA: SLAP domain-containing protein [Companilactobacillus farciminis]|uniref:SLAP domain-containing protein n=1 Tax=Companilactobacillus farciminis TaxID=1612 RepID=A0A921HSH5_9LACO|nr:SLAP domain-containing protein [Companilactobacillus farciminis]